MKILNIRDLNRDQIKRYLLPDDGEKQIVFVVCMLAAYLIFANLDYVALWHDEGTNAIMARNLVHVGELSGWDGRNLFFGNFRVDQGQYAIDNNFNMVAYPPWPAFPSALGILLFGDGEFALRFPHALLGALSLPVFYLLLRLNFPHHRRLRLLAFTLFALSPIVILYVRQGRYYADAILFTLVAFYCYQKFWRDDKPGWLAGLAVFTTLNFFNHFAIGFAAAAALVLWHLTYYWRDTSRRQWLWLFVTGATVAAVCGGYLLLSGIVGTNVQLEYGEGFYKFPWLQRHFLILTYYLKDTLRTGWLPLWVALWWVCYLTIKPILNIFWRWRNKKSNSKNKKTSTPSDYGKAALGWAFMAFLLIAVSTIISVQPATHNLADMRHMVMALPFVFLMHAACVDWVWTKNKFLGGGAAVILLFTNFAAFPYYVDIIQKQFNCPREKFPLTALIKEIHRPYPSAIAEATAYLRKHAKQDDTILVRPWQEYALMLYYVGDKLIFCCGLSDDSTLPKDKIRALGAPIYESDAQPMWQMTVGPKIKNPTEYKQVYTGEAFVYPTQRPELEYRCFEPPTKTNHIVKIYQRIAAN